MSDTESSKSVLFVCLGNICRSPIAEAVFKHVAKERGVLDEWVVDSAATGDWHVGRKPDKRAIQCMKDHKVEMDHRARLVTTDDFTTFQYIFGMDEANISDLHNLKPKKSTAQIELLGKYDPEGKTIIRDPYYDDGSQGFEDVYVQCLRCCKAFLDQVS